MAKKDDLVEVHKRAMKRADIAWEFERENILNGRDDQRFYAGDQWDEAAKKARGLDRPMLTINRLGTFVRQITGDIRQNTPAIKVLPAKGPVSQDEADTLNGMIRNIEAESDADACYSKAGENAAIAGQGAFRVVTEYEDETSFDQVIRIRPIPDPFAVLIDPMAILPDKSDMGHAYVFERLSKEDFEAAYPDKVASDIPVQGDMKALWWRTADSVRICEYWEVEKTARQLHELADGSVVDKLPAGVKPARSRDVDAVRVVSYMLSGKEVLSGPHEWAGKHIPICFVPGEETTIDGATRRKGMVRDAKDPQRLVNYARTTEAESTALQPKAPFIVTVDQVKGHEPMWKSAGTKNHPFLVYNRKAGDTGPAPERSQPPVMSSGLSNLSTLAGNDLHDVTGIYPASLGARSNETSGVAIRARQHEGDTGSNYIPDNVKRAITFCGRILCDLIPKIYDNERIIRVLKEDGSHEMQPINAQVTDPETGAVSIKNDLSVGKYDVQVSTGPSYLTRQQEMADTILQLSQNLPQVNQVAPDLLVKALNFPGGDEIAKRLERMLPPGITQDGPQQPPPPNPKDVASAMKDAATAKKLDAEAEGQHLENTALGLDVMAKIQALHVQIAALPAMIAAAAGQGGPPPQMPGAPPQAPPMMQQPGPPDAPELEPMTAPPGAGDAPQLEPLTHQ